MAFGFGVGDIFTLTRLVVDTIEGIAEAPQALQDLAEQVRLVDETLKLIDKELQHDAVKGITLSIVRRKERVKEVLNKISVMVVEYRDDQGRIKPSKRVLYSVWDKNHGFAKLVTELEKRADDLTTFLLIQTWRLTNQMRPLIDQILTSSRQVQERASDQSFVGGTNVTPHPRLHPGIDAQTDIPNQIDQVQAVFDRVLQNEVASSVTLQPDVSVDQELEAQLRNAGIDVTLTKALVEEIRKRRKQLTYSEHIDPISFSGGKIRLEIPKGWIMVVDSYNEVRSIIAQTYLELIRVWTANNGGEWLFNRVESAGVRIETDFSRRCLGSRPKYLIKGGNSPESAALRAISGKESHFRSEEKNDILARIAEHKSRGIDHWHFRKYEYVLCFSRSVYEAVITLAERCKKDYGHLPSYANLSRIILVKDLKLNDAAANLSADDTTRLVESIKDGIKGFLTAEYRWKRPPLSITGGEFRTKQITLLNSDTKLDQLSLAEKEAKLGDISTRTGCKIRVTDEKFDHQLFSITGRQEALPFASSLIREAFC